MRFNPAFTSALVSSATLLGYAHAEEAEKAADSTTSLAEKPTFTVCCNSSQSP
jgi:calnexin